MAPISQYLRHPFNPHARRRNEQAKFQRAQRQEEMAEAVLRADIPGADFERPVQNPLLYEATHQQRGQGAWASGRATQRAHVSSTDPLYEDNPNQLPSVRDRGATWAKHFARNDDDYWNSVLVEEDTAPWKRDANVPAYPYWMPTNRASTPDLIGRASWSLTEEQRAELEVLRAREIEALEKTALERQKGRKGKERAVEPEDFGEPEKPATHGSQHDQPSKQTDPFHQDLHIRMIRTDFDERHPPTSGPALEVTSHIAQGSLATRPHTHSSEALPTTSHSIEFDPSVLLPTDQPILIYRNREGNHRLVLPYEQARGQEEMHAQETQSHSPFLQRASSPQTLPHSLRIQNSKLPTAHHSPIATQSLSPTWNATLNNILKNEYVNPISVERVRKRASVNAGENGDGDESGVSAVHVGLVPNFSKPSAAAEWNDRLFAERSFQDQDQEWLENVYRPRSASTTSTVRSWLRYAHESHDDEIVEKEHCAEESRPLPDDDFASKKASASSTSSSRARYSDKMHVRPSGLATDSDVEEYWLQHPPSPTGSLTIRLRTQEKTLATQQKLIRTLHTKVDRLTEKLDRLVRMKDYYEGTLIPNLVGERDTMKTLIQEWEATYSTLDQENEELWKTVDFSKKVLRLCWQRDAEVKRMVEEIRSRKVQRGFMQRLFGVWSQQEPWVGRSVSRRSSRSSNVSPKTKPTRKSKSRANSLHTTGTPSEGESALYHGIFHGVSSNAGPPPPPLPSRANSRHPSVTNPPPRLKRSRTSNMSLVFSSTKSDLEALARVTEQNLKVLSEDVNDWSQMEERCSELRDGRHEREEQQDVRDV